MQITAKCFANIKTGRQFRGLRLRPILETRIRLRQKYVCKLTIKFGQNIKIKFIIEILFKVYFSGFASVNGILREKKTHEK